MFQFPTDAAPVSLETIPTTLKHTLDLLKTTSRRDTETTPPHSDTHASETLPNLAETYLDPQRQQHRPLYFMAHYFIKLTLQQRKQEM